MSADRPVTSGADIPDEWVDAYVGAIFTDWYIEMKGDELRQDVRAGLAAVVPLIRAQWEADLVAEAARVAHDRPAEFAAAHLGEWLARRPITLGRPTTVATASTVILAEGFYEPDEDPADVQAAYDAGEKGVTRRPAEVDPCGDVYADGPPLSRHTCGRPRGHDGAHRCRCPGFENYTWPAGGGDE